ncbi:MAG: hypothetical protein PPP55_05010 [Halorubrum sp.]
MSSAWGRVPLTLRVWIDAAGYALVLTAVTTLVAVALGLATGGGFVRGKFFTFLAGWVLVGYATVRLWPKRDEPGESLTGTRRTRFQRFVRAVPPIRWIRPPAPTERLRVAGKVFLAGACTLAVSVVMEVGFGIA